MKVKTIIKTGQLFMVAVLLAACANEDIAQDKKKENGTEAPKGGVVFATNDTKISAKRRFIDEDEFAGAKTRTLITHTPGNGADAVWTSTDAIWVKAVDGTWKRSTAITLHDGGTSAEFTLPGSKTDYADGCEVRYTGNGGLYDGYDNFRIPYSQPQTVRNDFSRAPDWGDCGSGVARNTGNPNKFNFTLKHLASYLCFLPRCENTALAPNIVLRKISISAQSAVSGGNPFLTDGRNFTSDGKHIEAGPYIYTSQANSSAELPVSDFAIPTTRADAIQSACYAVIIPGTYNFTITYTIYDPTTSVTGEIVEQVNNVPCGEGVINDITANLVPLPAPPTLLFYMWDAQQHYWYGHLNPDGTPDNPNNYPQSSSDPRWYNDFSNSGRYDAQTALFQTIPNANELCWYIMKGDAHYEPKTQVVVDNNHLKSINMSGIWLRKKSAIVAYLKANEGYPATLTWNDLKEAYKETFSSAPKDYRADRVSYSIFKNSTQGAPPNTSDYFFLRESQAYENSYLLSSTIYWTSSADPFNSSRALSLRVAFGRLVPDYIVRKIGCLAVAFE